MQCTVYFYTPVLNVEGRRSYSKVRKIHILYGEIKAHFINEIETA